MKNFYNISYLPLLILFLFFTTKYEAVTWEIALRVTDGGIPSSEVVKVYKFNYATRNIELIRQGYTYSDFYFKASGKDCNGRFDIHSVNTDSVIFSAITSNMDILYIKIGSHGNQMLKLDYIGWPAAYGDITIEYPGYNILDNNSGYSTSMVTIDEKTITLKNDFGTDRTNPNVKGIIKLNNEVINNVGYAGINKTRISDTFPHTISGQDNQYVASYYRKWRYWNVGGSSISQQLTSPDNYSRTAVYAKKCNVTMQNDFGPSGNGGNIKFQSGTYGSPYQPAEILESDFYSIEAISHSFNSVNYTFSHWEFNSTNIGSQNPKTNFNVNVNGILKAKFIGKPVNNYRNQNFNGSTYNNPVRVNWNKHPLDNSAVTKYAVWRKVKPNPAQLVTTITADGSASYTFVDNAYFYSPVYDLLLSYDIRAYYEPSGTYSDPDFVSCFGTIGFKKMADYNAEIPLENNLFENYPNPFNPSTKIKFSIKEDSYVSLKVYDILGREIQTIVNENIPAGTYTFNFEAEGLPSGLYVYTLKTKNYFSSKKMLLTK